MMNEESDNGMETVEVPLVLPKEDYELIERISVKLGIGPSSWICLALSSKLREMVLDAKDEGMKLMELDYLG